MVSGFNSFNYMALNLKGNKQMGSNKIATEGKLDLTDGLSAEELKTIDANGDGSITATEFKKAYNGDDSKANELWKQYTEFYSLKSKKTDTGHTTTAKVDDKNITSTYDKKGNLTGYKETTVDENGVKTVVTYTVKDGKKTKKSTSIINPDGTREIVNDKKDTTTKKSTDNTSVTTNENNKVVNVASSNGKNKVKFNYNKKGKIKGATVTINGKTYKGSDVTTSKDGKTITIKDKDGNVVAKYITQDDGSTRVIGYKDGDRACIFTMDENMQVKSYHKVATSGKNKGKVTSYTNCKTGKTNKFEYDEDGNRTSSTTYDKDGKKVSKQTYAKKTADDFYKNKTGSLVSSKTLYDENGNVTGYIEYKYKTNEKKNDITVTKTTYKDETKKEKVSTTTSHQDSYGNVKKEETKDADGNITTKTYTYNVDKIDSKLTTNDIATVVTNKGNQTITSTYTNGKVTKKEIVTIEDGISSKKTYEYSYYENSNVLKTMVVILPDGTVQNYKYDTNGNLIEE